VVSTIPLVAVEPVQEGVVERCMHLATEGKLVESVGCVWVRLEKWCHRPWGSICAGAHVSCATRQESAIMSEYESGIIPV
jgi:hypothetical protein